MPLADAAHLYIPGLRNGKGRYCITCLDKLMFKGGHKDVRGFIAKTILDNKPRTALEQARARIAELEAEIEKLLDS